MKVGEEINNFGQNIYHPKQLQKQNIKYTPRRFIIKLISENIEFYFNMKNQKNYLWRKLEIWKRKTSLKIAQQLLSFIVDFYTI